MQSLEKMQNKGVLLNHIVYKNITQIWIISQTKLCTFSVKCVKKQQAWIINKKNAVYNTLEYVEK